MRSMLMFDDLSFLQSGKGEGSLVEGDKEVTIGRTSDFFVYSTKSCVRHNRTQKRV
jgi:hypothetical protein